MENKDIVNAYKNGKLKSLELKKQIQRIKSFENWQKIDSNVFAEVFMKTFSLDFDISSVRAREENENQRLDEEYLYRITLLKKLNSWEFIGLNPEEETFDKFRELSSKEKQKKLFEMKEKYLEFIKSQKIVNILSYLEEDSDLDKNVEKLNFIDLMFKNIKSYNAREYIGCADDKFLKMLINFRKGKEEKNCNLEEFIQKQDKSIQFEYYNKIKKLNIKDEDLMQVADFLILIKNNLKIPNRKAFGILRELSVFENNIGDFEDFINIENKKSEQKFLEGSINENTGNTTEYEKELEKNKTTPTVKESVIPLIIRWFDKEDISLEEKIGKENLKIFDEIKQLEKIKGKRVALFIITNSGKEVSQKRLNEFQEMAEKSDLSRCVEGIIGGYGSFKIETDGSIVDFAEMSTNTRNEIINSLNDFYKDKNTSEILKLTPDKVDESETDHLRYVLSDDENQFMTKEILNNSIKELLKSDDINKQAIMFIPFIENKKYGIDIILRSQFKAISNDLLDYYSSKYHINYGSGVGIDIEEIGKIYSLDKSNDEEIEI